MSKACAAQWQLPKQNLHRVNDKQESRDADLIQANHKLSTMNAEERVAWALQYLPGNHVLSSSFGVQAAVMLRLATLVKPDIPVIFIDTGYHFAETYQFVDQLQDRLELNLKIYRATLSSAWQEAKNGRRWERGLTSLNQYNYDNKVEPMQRALKELRAGTWLAGLRRNQDAGRAGREFLEGSTKRWKVHPVVDWSDRDVFRFLKAHELPYHPLWDKGYLSIGDYHSTRSVHEVSDLSELRFHGLKRECGLHEFNLADV